MAKVFLKRPMFYDNTLHESKDGEPVYVPDEAVEGGALPDDAVLVEMGGEPVENEHGHGLTMREWAEANMKKAGKTPFDNITDSAIKLAGQHGISLKEIEEKVEGTGSEGRVVKADMTAYIEAKEAEKDKEEVDGE